MRAVLPLAVALALFATPGALAAKPFAPKPPMQHKTPAGIVQELILANGMKVLLQENHAAPVVSWIVFYRVGSRNEPAGATGSAHLLEHMLFKGTKTLGKGQVAQLFGRNGADFNASTWDDFTNYFETYSSDRLELGLVIEAARMRDALILDTERQSEMTVVRNEMERGESNPEDVLWENVSATAYRAHPYHHPVIGWRSDVEGVSTQALRDFYQTHYVPNNAVAILSGDFRTPEAIALIRRHFEGIPRGPKPPQMYTQEEAQVGERRVTLRRRGETNLVQLAHHTPAARHRDMAALLVLDKLLAKGVSSRLHQAVVETQLGTEVWADAGMQLDPSLFRVGVTVAPGVDPDKAEQAMVAALERVKHEPVAAAELAKAKTLAEAAFVYDSEGTEGLAWALGMAEMQDRWQRFFELLEQIKGVSAADLQRVANTYLTGDNRTVGRYVSTPDGPVPPAPKNSGGGKAVANSAKVKPAQPLPFERSASKPRALAKPVRKVLSNGLTVVVLENPASPTVSVSGFVQAGSYLTSEAKRGLADVVGDMLAQGTTRRSKLQLAQDLESQATTIDFTGGVENTRIEGKMLAAHADAGFAAIAEMLREPAFPADELEKVKKARIAEVLNAKDDPRAQATRALSQAVYPQGHPYRELDPDARIRNFEALTLDDVKGFHTRYVGPNTTTLVVVGKVKAEQVFTRLEQLFGGWRQAKHLTPAIPDVPVGPARNIDVRMPDKTNMYVLLGSASPVRRASKDYYAALLANHVLGGGSLSSRLGLRLRDEMGLTYGTRSSFDATLGAGPWSVFVTVNPANSKIAVSELRRIVRDTLGKGLTVQELSEAKSSYIGSQAVTLSTNAGMATSLAEIEKYGLGLDYWSRYPGLIQSVTMSDVNTAARRLIAQDKLHLIQAGPVK